MFVYVDWTEGEKEKGKQRLFAISLKPVAIISVELLLT